MTTADPAATCPNGWRLIAHGAGFVEGPVAQGNAVDFVSVNRGSAWRANLDGSGFHQRAELGAGPNGAAADASGRLWVVQNGGRVMESRSDHAAEPGIQVVTDGGCSTELANADLSAPNDCAFGPDGRLWFTDPYGRLMSAPAGDPDRENPHGRVWAYELATGALELILDGLMHPNGLCFNPDGDLLYVSDTRLRAVFSTPTGSTSARTATLVATLPEGEPDGMAFDRSGRLWIAALSAEGLAVLSPDGSWELVPLGSSYPTNLCFAGPDLTSLVVTAARGGRVMVRDDMPNGLPLYRP